MIDSATIDDTHSRAICDEIGERLRMLLKTSISGETTDLDEKLAPLVCPRSDDGESQGDVNQGNGSSE